jgi:hypothetical protein
MKRATTRPHLQVRDRLFWIAVARLWPNWHRDGTRAAGHGRAVASPVAPTPINPTFEVPTGRPSANRSAHPRARPPDGDGESIVGSTEDSRRVGHPRCQRLRTHGVASATTAPTSAFANMANVPHQSHCVSCVDGFLHCSDDHRPDPVRPRLVVAAPPADRAGQHHRSPDGDVGRATGCRRVSRRHGGRWVHRDRDSIYGDVFRRRLAGLGITEVVSAPARPWEDPYVERLIGSIRRECLNHVIVINEAHLRRLLTAYRRYYHGSRTHLGLPKDTPDHQPVSDASTGPIVAIPEVGGLHHRYERCAA